MKNIYAIVLLLLTSCFAYGQNELGISASTSTPCSGDPVTISLDNATGQQLFTTDAAGNSAGGAMFDITTQSAVVIKGFNVWIVSGTVDIEVYYKSGTHVGSETTAGDWTLAGSSTGISGSDVDAGVVMNLSIPSGSTYAFYVTATNGSLSYTNGTNLGDPYSNDANLTILEGVGKGYPFAGTFTPRVLNCRVNYDLDATFAWSSGGVSAAIADNPTASKVYSATVTYAGGGDDEFSIGVAVPTSTVDVTATPATVCDTESSTLAATVTSTGTLYSPLLAGNGQNGVMFDVLVSDDIVLTDFYSTTDNGPANYEVYMKSGTHVGSETTAGDWTLLASVSGIADGPAQPLGLGLSESLAAGNTYAFYITTDGTGDVDYTNGNSVGDVLASNSQITIYQGVGKSYPFGSTFTTRTFNGAMIYETSDVSYSWSSGGSSGSVNVTPTATTTYTVDVTSLGCTSQGSVVVNWDPCVGVDRLDEAFSVSLFPNPANDNVTVNIQDLTIGDLNVQLTNIAGQVVFDKDFNQVSGTFTEQLETSNLANGLYIVTLRHNDKTSSHKVTVQH